MPPSSIEALTTSAASRSPINSSCRAIISAWRRWLRRISAMVSTKLRRRLQERSDASSARSSRALQEQFGRPRARKHRYLWAFSFEVAPPKLKSGFPFFSRKLGGGGSAVAPETTADTVPLCDVSSHNVTHLDGPGRGSSGTDGLSLALSRRVVRRLMMAAHPLRKDHARTSLPAPQRDMRFSKPDQCRPKGSQLLPGTRIALVAVFIMAAA